jgi:tetratricopeptide (TPR) repeat protein
MPAHIYFRVGRYHDAAAANERAIAADHAYLDGTAANRSYMSGYAAHNYHFLTVAAMMAGQSALALSAATAVETYVRSLASTPKGTEAHYLVLPLYVHVRFGNWAAIRDAPRPPAAIPYTDGVWHYARGMAFVRTGALERARHEFDALQESRRTSIRRDMLVKNTHPASRLLELCARVLEAELEAAGGHTARAIGHARAAVKLESALERDEPPVWALPVRHVLGALLLEHGHAATAERVYREDLAVYPRNGWSLAGLAESLERQRKSGAARTIRARFDAAWANADVAIAASRF